MGNQTGDGCGVSGISIVIPKSGGGTGTITVQDEGTTVSDEVTTINFVGSDVSVYGSGDTVTVYVPSVVFASHFNTTDGSTTGTVSESGVSRSTARISTPDSEGTPFATNGWAGTNQSATLSTTATFTTGGAVTGLGGNAYFVIDFLDADGSTVLSTVTTSAITADGSYGNANLQLTVSNYALDTLKYKANISVTVQSDTILSDNSRSGGRYQVRITNYTDTTTDGTGPYTYTQTAVFLDTNPTTPSISGTTTISETSGSVLTKHLSGLEYYAQNTQFTIAVTDIDQLNRNTARTSGNLTLNGGNYQLGTLNQSPFGSGSSNFSGWTNAYDQDGVDYSKTDWAITGSTARYRGTSATASAQPSDTWGSGSSVSSSADSILIDTYGTTSSDLVEDFDDENRRQDSTWNTGSTSGNWDSTATLASGEAMIIAGRLMAPDVAYLSDNSVVTDWSSYSPNSGGANPDYTGLTVPVNYYRTIVDTSGSNRSSFTIVFSGTFVSNATTDLLNSDLEIFISRRASAGGGNSGYDNTDLLELHGPNYNFATFDDGVTDGHIREASSSGSTVNATFGGFSCEDGFFMHIRINDNAIKIDRLSVTFF